MWMTFTRQRTGQGWHKTSIYEYKLWRWAVIINNLCLHRAVEIPLLLFVLGLNAICTLMQLNCLPLMRRMVVNKMTGINWNLLRDEFMCDKLEALAGKSFWNQKLWKIKKIAQIKYCLLSNTHVHLFGYHSKRKLFSCSARYDRLRLIIVLDLANLIWRQACKVTKLTVRSILIAGRWGCKQSLFGNAKPWYNQIISCCLLTGLFLKRLIWSDNNVLLGWQPKIWQR